MKTTDPLRRGRRHWVPVGLAILALLAAAGCGSNTTSGGDGAGGDGAGRLDSSSDTTVPDGAVVPPDGPAPPPPDGPAPPPPDGTVDSTPPDGTVDSTPPDGTVDFTPPDSTVDSTPPPPDGPMGTPIVDLRGDVNRNGTVDLTDPTEDAAEETWDETHGAIFLANIDDDNKDCPPVTSNVSDVNLAKCHDADDDTIDGQADLADLAPLRTVAWPGAPAGAVGKIKLSLPAAPASDARTYVRLFKSDGSNTPAGHSVFAATDQLGAAELRQGVALALEGRDIVRDKAIWDGYVDVTFEVSFTQGGQLETLSDTLRMRVAPVLTSHHLQATEQLFVTSLNETDSTVFRADLAAALAASGATKPMVEFGIYDQWTQDLFEAGWMAMPAAGGKQQAITVYLRSANVEAPSDPIAPLRYASRVVFLLRGPDVAAVQQFRLNHNASMDSLDSLGNLETIPPYSHGGQSYPMGRMIMGSVPTFFVDPAFSTMLASQQVQPPVWIDTSWLLVGHTDETISFIPAPATARGWMVALNDPQLALQMLQDASDAGHGAVKMFVGKKWLNDNGSEVSATVTIDQVLADTEVMAESAKAVTEVAAQLAQLKQETGITDAEIIKVPFLHYPVSGYSVAYQPGTVNSTLLSATHYAAPETQGPVINGVDIFKKQMTDAFAAHGITVHYIENWNLYHRLLGEVHCGSNAQRAVPTNVKWWESGR